MNPIHRIAVALFLMLVAPTAFAQPECIYKKTGPFTCGGCYQSSTAHRANLDHSCTACSAFCTPLFATPEDGKSTPPVAVIAGSEPRGCNFAVSDDADLLFYVVDVPEKIARELARALPASASTLFSFRQEGATASPIDMRSGAVNYELIPTEASVWSKFMRDNDKALNLQRPRPPGQWLRVEFRSDRLESGELVLTLDPGLRNEKEELVSKFEPAVELRLRPTSRSIPVTHAEDRAAQVLEVTGFRVLQ